LCIFLASLRIPTYERFSFEYKWLSEIFSVEQLLTDYKFTLKKMSINSVPPYSLLEHSHGRFNSGHAPPILVVLLMQRLFVKELVERE